MGRIIGISAAVVLGLGAIGLVLEEQDPEPDPAPIDGPPPMEQPMEPMVSGSVGMPEPEATTTPTQTPAPSPQQALPAQPMPEPAPDQAAEIARSVAAQMQPMLPQIIQPGLYMTRAVASGRTLTFHVVSEEFLAPDAVPLLRGVLQEMAQQSCADQLTFAFVRAGGTLTYRFSGLNDVAFDVSVNRC